MSVFVDTSAFFAILNKEHWMPLESQTQATQREMERLAQVIAQAQRSGSKKVKCFDDCPYCDA